MVTRGSGDSRLAHGWRLRAEDPGFGALVREFLRPAVRAIPPALAARLGPCRITLRRMLEEPSLASRWTAGEILEIELATGAVDPHDAILELLTVLGEALWHRLTPGERRNWWRELRAEIDAGVTGEVDEDALAAKRRLPAHLEEYGRAAFAGTAAEFIHALWHDVTVRSGPDHLPAPWLRRRLELLRRSFPCRGKLIALCEE
jgi:hypothetical protein